MARRETYSEGSEGIGAQGHAAGSMEGETRIGAMGSARAEGNPLRSIYIVVGIVNLLAAFSATFERFHMLLAIACFVSAGSLVLGFWKRSPTQALDEARAPVACSFSSGRSASTAIPSAPR